MLRRALWGWATLMWVFLPVLAWAESGGVAIVNGTDDDSASSTLGAVLEEQGFEIVRTGSTKGGAIRKNSSVWCRDAFMEGASCRFLTNRLLPEGGRPRALPVDSGDDYLVVIGEDLLDYLDSQSSVSRPRTKKFKRSGFLIGFSVGWADGRVDPESGSNVAGNGPLTTFDIGGTIRDKVALMYRSTTITSSSTRLNSAAFAARAFLPSDYYVTAGIGLGMVSGKERGGGLGFGYVMDVGKEWPLFTHFVLGGEISHAGQLAGGSKGFLTGAGLTMRWYWPGRNR